MGRAFRCRGGASLPPDVVADWSRGRRALDGREMNWVAQHPPLYHVLAVPFPRVGAGDDAGPALALPRSAAALGALRRRGAARPLRRLPGGLRRRDLRVRRRLGRLLPADVLPHVFGDEPRRLPRPPLRRGRALLGEALAERAVRRRDEDGDRVAAAGFTKFSALVVAAALLALLVEVRFRRAGRGASRSGSRSPRSPFRCRPSGRFATSCSSETRAFTRSRSSRLTSEVFSRI